MPTPNLVEALRLYKEPEEIAALQRAVDLGDAAFTDVAERIEPGWTEKQVAWEIEKYIREHGGDGLSFDTIVAGGPWGAMPHAYPRERKLEAGEGVVIDMGCDVAATCPDLTRTIYLGKPNDKFRKVYDIVLTAQLTAEELVRPGMTGEECHMIAHNVIEAAGYGETFGHGLGHGIGLQVPRSAARRPHVERRTQGQHGVHDRAGHLHHRLGRRADRGYGRPRKWRGARDEPARRSSASPAGNHAHASFMHNKQFSRRKKAE